MTKISRSDLPTIAPNRVWNITHNPKSETKPVTLELLEYSTKTAQERSLLDFTRRIGFITVKSAARDEIIKAAVTLFDRVNDVDEVVGTY